MTLRLIIAGAAGRMGERIAALAAADPELKVIYGLEAGEKREQRDFPIGPDRDQLAGADVVIDFSAPEASSALAEEVARRRKPWVLGTTGFSEEQNRRIAQYAREIPILKSPNMSLGVNVLFKLCREAAKVLKNYEVHIVEAHHQHKKDAPSGTALQAGRGIEESGGQSVRYESIREGEIVGDHRVVFTGTGERLELFHHAGSRDTFAAGSLQAAKWLVHRKPGLYGMQDVLGL